MEKDHSSTIKMDRYMIHSQSAEYKGKFAPDIPTQWKLNLRPKSILNSELECETVVRAFRISRPVKSACLKYGVEVILDTSDWALVKQNIWIKQRLPDGSITVKIPYDLNTTTNYDYSIPPECDCEQQKQKKDSGKHDSNERCYYKVFHLATREQCSEWLSCNGRPSKIEEMGRMDVLSVHSNYSYINAVRQHVRFPLGQVFQYYSVSTWSATSESFLNMVVDMAEREDSNEFIGKPSNGKTVEYLRLYFPSVYRELIVTNIIQDPYEFFDVISEYEEATE